MQKQQLPIVQERKYNVWRERRGLVCADENRMSRATRIAARRDLAQSEQAAFYLHELTGCEGLEFVVLSNAKLKRHVQLASGVILAWISQIG